MRRTGLALVAACLLPAPVAMARAGCAAPTLDFLWGLPAIRQAMLTQHAAGVELQRLPQARQGTQPAGHWVHLSGSGPVHGALAWVPCTAAGQTASAAWVRTRAAGVRVLNSGGFVGWSGLPLQGPLPARLVLTHRHTGTGLESHATLVVALQRGRLRVLLRETTYELASLREQHQTTRHITGLSPGLRVQVRSETTVDGRQQARSQRPLCWLPARQQYGRCSALIKALRGSTV